MKTRFADVSTPEPAADHRVEALRRLLLGLVTALLVARPFVLGEDPGLLAPLSSTSGMVLTLFWFVAAAAWAAWRAWSGQRTWHGSAMEFGLLAVVGLVFVSAAGAARYKHPAWLIAWEWAALLLSFCLVRQLARTADDGRGLLAALLATGVCLSAYAVYQYTVEMPQTRSRFGDEGELVQSLARQGIHLGADDPLLKQWQKRIHAKNVFATYAHPNAFAGYLALLLPASVGIALVSVRSRAPTWRRCLTAGAAAVFSLALWLTHSRGATLAVLLVGFGIVVFSWRAFLWSHRIRVVLAMSAVVALGLLVLKSGRLQAAFEKDPHSAGYRLDYWTATGTMIRDHFWLGVGPGNFGRRYPRYMSPAALEKVQDPHNFALEIWATCGVLGLAALLGMLAVFFWHTRRAWLASVPREPVESLPLDPSKRWTFYLGGMAGLLLSFLLRTSSLSPDEILMEGLVSGVRSLIWFVAFALFDAVPWTGPSRVLALTAGVAALLLNLTVSGGIGAPSVVQPLLAMAALALNSLERDPFVWTPKQWWSLMLPLPLSAGLACVYFFVVFQPVTDCAGALHEARLHGGVFATRVQEVMDRAKKEPRSEDKIRALAPIDQYLSKQILKPLQRAHDADPGDATPQVELANWYGERWKLFPGDLDLGKRAVASAVLAQHLDPDGKDGYYAEYRLRMLFAQRSKTDAVAQHNYAARALRAIVDRDPTEARLHYQLAETLFLAGNKTEAMLQAEEARRLDQMTQYEERQLYPAQREQVAKWLDTSGN